MMTSARVCIGIFVAALLVCRAAAGVEHVAAGVDLIPGRLVPGHQPDGNSVVLRAPEGLIVVDTGRHAEHTRALIDYAKRAEQPIFAVINTHWHLDHIGGNPMIRRAYPHVRVYASAALAGAMTGFLADYRKQLEGALAAAAGKPDEQGPLRDELAILDAGPALFPDEIVTGTRTRTIAGRQLVLHLETDAVTAGDVWVFDPSTRVLVAGDLITWPVPFLDTACPALWKDALDVLAKTDFAVLIPGHGPPMRRPQLETYRVAYAHLLDCAGSAKAKSACMDGWLHDVGDLVPAGERAFAREMMDYYLDHALRGPMAKRCAGQKGIER